MWDYGVTRITDATELPVTVEELKDHLRVEHDADDALINGYSRAAMELVQEHTGRSLVSESYRLRLFRWPRGTRIELPNPPLVTVDTFEYTLDGEVSTTAVDSDAYQVITDVEPGRIQLEVGHSWPSGTLDAGSGINIEFTTGYGDRADVPERVKQAIKLLVGHWYAHRESVITGTISKAVEMAYQSLVNADRIFWTGP